MKLLHSLRSWRNPHGETRIHLAAGVRRRGFEIGAYSYGRPKVRFAGAGARLIIGRYCSIADQVEILLGGNHRTQWATTYPFDQFPALWKTERRRETSHVSRGSVIIGHDVWLGSGCMILSGVRIGHGAVVAARAVVTRDVPPYAIVGGNPAKLIRSRFGDATVAALLDIAWWDLPKEEIEPLIPLLQSERIEELIAAVRARRARSSRSSGDRGSAP